PDDYLPNIWEYGMFSDKKYGVPTALCLLMIYYNKTIFREMGLDPDCPPKTLDELTSVAHRLSLYDENDKLKRIGFVPSTTYIWFWNFGGRIYDAETRRFTFHSPENLRALEWMTSFYREYGIDQYRRFVATYGEYDSPNNPLYTGKFAMREDGQWQISFIKQYAPSLDYGIMPYVSMVEGQKSVSSVSGSFWVIPTGCPHPEEAWEFLHWLISPPQSSRFAAALANIPPLKDSLYHDNYRDTLQSKMKIFIDLFLEGRTRYLPALPVGQLLNTELSGMEENVYAGDLTPKEGLKLLDERLQKELDKELHNLGLDRNPS
ncbi:MAG: extracellular solute-binding protein, partial [bacterium]